MKHKTQKGMDSSKNFLYRQLIRFGDMMGDGLHHEPDGKWIEKEYKNILRALGIYPKRKNNSKIINKLMFNRVQTVKCQKCKSTLQQTRLGSMRARCTNCGTLYQLLTKIKEVAP
jgi:hypothetical protein